MQVQNRVGQQFGNYRLTQLIGSGGYAEVYLATHIHLNRQYAVKILTGTNLQEEQRNDFLREAQTVANLQHLSSHIVQIQDFGIQTSGNPAQDGIPYLVMEYAAAGTMRTLYPHDQRVPLDKIVFYINQVAEALQCAHDQKPPIIHRDIKPENMLLRTREHLLLSDFGIAIAGQATSHIVLVKEQEIVGTVTYMAPERLSKHTRRASDQYSLGIVVYEWLSGSPPFEGTEKEIIYQQMTMTPPSLSSQYPHITQEIEDVVFRALEKNPDNRYHTVREFAQALEQAVQRARQKKLPGQPSAIKAQQGSAAQPRQDVSTQSKMPAPSISQSELPTFVPASVQVQSPVADLPTLPSQAPHTPALPQSQAQPASAHTPASLQSQAPASPSPLPAVSWPQMSQSATIPDPQPQIATPPAPSQAQSQISLPAVPAQAQSQISLPLILPDPHQAARPSLSSPTPQPASTPLNPPTPPPYGKPSTGPYAGPSFSARGSSLARQSGGMGSEIQQFFEFSTRFLWNPSSATFIYGGLFLNLLAAVLLTFLAHSALILIGGFIFSLLAFLLCICAVRTPLAIFFGALVALYWSRVGWLAGAFLVSWQHLNPLLPPPFLALVFFIGSLIIHIRYATRKDSRL